MCGSNAVSAGGRLAWCLPYLLFAGVNPCVDENNVVSETRNCGAMRYIIPPTAVRGVRALLTVEQQKGEHTIKTDNTAVRNNAIQSGAFSCLNVRPFGWAREVPTLVHSRVDNVCSTDVYSAFVDAQCATLTFLSEKIRSNVLRLLVPCRSLAAIVMFKVVGFGVLTCRTRGPLCRPINRQHDALVGNSYAHGSCPGPVGAIMYHNEQTSTADVSFAFL